VEIRAASQGAAHVDFAVHVRPRARRASVGGEHAEALEVRVRAAPGRRREREVIALVARARPAARDVELSGATPAQAAARLGDPACWPDCASRRAGRRLTGGLA
jgi:uncharacterized protein YggU (UPF0235/DUF167 family)